MNPTTHKAHRITPDCQPVFPCWLFLHECWSHCPTARSWNHHFWDATHWHPDQPHSRTPVQVWTTPTIPGTAQAEVRELVENIRGAASPDAAENIGREFLERVIDKTKSVIARRFPAPSPGASGELIEDDFFELKRQVLEIFYPFVLYTSQDPEVERKLFKRLLTAIAPFLSKLAAPSLPGGTLVDGKDGGRDTKRLDWLEQNWTSIEYQIPSSGADVCLGREEKLRMAIDMAMSAQADAGREEK